MWITFSIILFLSRFPPPVVYRRPRITNFSLPQYKLPSKTKNRLEYIPYSQRGVKMYPICPDESLLFKSVGVHNIPSLFDPKLQPSKFQPRNTSSPKTSLANVAEYFDELNSQTNAVPLMSIPASLPSTPSNALFLCTLSCPGHSSQNIPWTCQRMSMES